MGVTIITQHFPLSCTLLWSKI